MRPTFNNNCPQCRNKGYIEVWDKKLCMRCGGSGYEHNKGPFQLDTEITRCYNCNGSGHITGIHREPCPKCH